MAKAKQEKKTEKKVQQYKIDAVQSLKEEFEGVNDFFFTNYRGLTVEQITALRGKLRENDGEFRVVKNNFARIAFRDMDQDELDDFLVGPTALALARGESGPVAKELVEFAKESPVELKGGLVNGNIYSSEDVEAYSKLPTRLELIQMLMGTMQAPARDMAATLNAVPEKLVRTLKAVADQKAEQG